MTRFYGWIKEKKIKLSESEDILYHLKCHSFKGIVRKRTKQLK